MRQQHGLLLFLASCIPGCGQMHQGYMRRGISLLLAFCGIFVLALALSGALVTFMAVVWLYAFFDSYNLRARIADGTEGPDAFLFGLSDLDSQRLSDLLRKRHSLIGWCLVGVGAYLLYRCVANSLVNWLGQFFDSWFLNALLLYTLPQLVMTLLVIALGLWFIRGPKKPEEVPIFVPPAPQEAPADSEAASADSEAPAQPAAAPTSECPAEPEEVAHDRAQ